MASRFPMAPLLGALIHLTRDDPAAAAAQGALLSAIRGLLKRRPLRITAEREFLMLDDEAVPLSVPGATLLNEQLLLHGIGELEIPADADAQDLIRLATVLAAFGGTYDNHEAVVAALGASAARFKLSPASLELELHARAGRTRIGPPGEQPESIGGIERSDADSITLAVPTPEGDAELLTGGTLSQPRPSLTVILDRGRHAIELGDWNALLDAGLQLVQQEEESPSGPEAEVYRRELKRLVSPDLLGRIAGFTHSERRQEAIGLLRRFGPAATETLVELLVEATDLGERRGYYSAITQMGEGAETIIGRLDHPLWYVIRNAAELCGDMELASAIPALSRQIHHADERVRKSVASALARIGTPAALRPLRSMLLDDASAVRRQALVHLSGLGARELCPAIAWLLERERDPELQRDAMFALGRIGSKEAIQVLDSWTAPGPLRSSVTPLPVRLLAVEALGLAGPVASGVLSRLTRDAVPEVRAAAGDALAALRP